MYKTIKIGHANVWIAGDPQLPPTPAEIAQAEEFLNDMKSWEVCGAVDTIYPNIENEFLKIQKMTPEVKKKVIERINNLLLFLTPEERTEVLQDFCPKCGKEKTDNCCKI